MSFNNPNNNYNSNSTQGFNSGYGPTQPGFNNGYGGNQQVSSQAGFNVGFGVSSQPPPQQQQPSSQLGFGMNVNFGFNANPLQGINSGIGGSIGFNTNSEQGYSSGYGSNQVGMTNGVHPGYGQSGFNNFSGQVSVPNKLSFEQQFQTQPFFPEQYPTQQQPLQGNLNVTKTIVKQVTTTITDNNGNQQGFNQPKTKQDCPKCNGQGGLGTFGPCFKNDMHFKRDCSCCTGKGFVYGNLVPCSKCAGKGALGTFGPCEREDVHYKSSCPFCEGKCFV